MSGLSPASEKTAACSKIKLGEWSAIWTIYSAVAMEKGGWELPVWD